MLRILSNLARSGGTLLGRCVGCMDSVILLSEIHPLGTGYYNPLEQACLWHGLLTRDELSRLRLPFRDAIHLIAERAAAASKQLVIRDWAHLDYVGYPFIPRPAGRSLLVEALADGGDLRMTWLVRHPLDTWISLKKLPAMQELPLASFLAGYRRYAEHASAGTFIRYEDFTRSPLPVMQSLCASLQLDYDAYFIHKWQHYEAITGAVAGMARGSGLQSITPLPRLPVEPLLQQQLQDNADYHAALQLLGY